MTGSSKGIRGVRWALLACSSTVSTLFMTQAINAGAASPSNLSSEIVSTTLPEFVATPLGPTNGPLTQATVNQFGGHAQGVVDLGQQLANGNVTGYVRVWAHAPPDGDAIEVLAVHFSDPADIPGALSGFADAASQADASQFTVPNIPGAIGREATLATAGGAHAKTYF